MTWQATQTSSTNISTSEWNSMVSAIRHTGASDLWSTFSTATDFIFDADGDNVYFKASTVQMFHFDENSGDSRLWGKSAVYPYIDFIDGADLRLSVVAGGDVIFRDATTQYYRFYVSGDVSEIRGHAAANKDVRLKANESDDGAILIEGGGDITVTSDDDFLVLGAGKRMFTAIIADAAGSDVCRWYGGDSTSTDLVIYPSNQGGRPYMTFHGRDNAGDIELDSATDILFKEMDNRMFTFKYENSTGSSTIEGGISAASSFTLKANTAQKQPYIQLRGDSGNIELFASGNISFGTYTHGTVTSRGYMTMKTSTGSTIKVMVGS